MGTSFGGICCEARRNRDWDFAMLCERFDLFACAEAMG
jgi:hypothetical protein